MRTTDADTDAQLAGLKFTIVRLRGKGWTEEEIIDKIGEILADTLPVPEDLAAVADCGGF